MSADSLAMFVCDDLVELKAWPLSSLKPHQYEEGFGCFLVWVDQSWRSSGVWHWSPVITEMPQCHNGWNGVSWLTFSQITHSPNAPFSLGHTTNSLVHNVLLPVLLHGHLGDSLEWPGPVPSWMDVFLCFGSVLTLYVYIYGLCSLGSVGGGNPLYCPGSLPLSLVTWAPPVVTQPLPLNLSLPADRHLPEVFLISWEDGLSRATRHLISSSVGPVSSPSILKEWFPQVKLRRENVFTTGPNVSSLWKYFDFWKGHSFFRWRFF